MAYNANELAARVKVLKARINGVKIRQDGNSIFSTSGNAIWKIRPSVKNPGRFWCDCPASGFKHNKWCKHLEKAAREGMIPFAPDEIRGEFAFLNV